VNTSRIAARLALPALVAGAVLGGTVAPASAEPSTAQGHQDLLRDLRAEDGGLLDGLLGGGSGGDSLLGSDGAVGGLVNSLLGPGGVVDGLL
jgi:hypothetical protein